MFFPEIFYFLSVFFLRKFHQLATEKTVLKKRMTKVISLAFLIFKTSFRPVLFCFRLHRFLRQCFFCWSETDEMFVCLPKFLFRCGVGYSVWMFGNVLPIKFCASLGFPVGAMFPVLLIAFSPDLSALFRIQI
jgi:hypothetical protein